VVFSLEVVKAEPKKVSDAKSKTGLKQRKMRKHHHSKKKAST
jgi:hypothetical protein